MWPQRLFLFTLLAFPGIADKKCQTNPGEPPSVYSDGSFNVPSSSTPSFSVGTTMNVSWTTNYESATLWLITGCDWDHPALSLATGISYPFFQWEVSTTSTNTSQVYMFRVVNTDGTYDELHNGGFLSATFEILGGPSLSSSSITQSSPTASLQTSSRGAGTSTPSTYSNIISTSTGQLSSSSPITQGGLSQGGKIGVGVGVGIGAIGMVGLGTGIYLWGRSRKTSKRPAPVVEEHRTDSHGAISSAQGFDAFKGASDHYNEAQHGDDGSMAQMPPLAIGASIVPEMYSGQRSPRYFELP